MRIILAVLVGLMLTACAPPKADVRRDARTAAIQIQKLSYRHGDTVMQGYLAFDPAQKFPRPGVLVIHEWYGLNDYAQRRARELAALGYVALAADMYGDGKVAADRKEAGALAGALRQDRALMRARARAGLAALRALPQTDPQRLGAMGYCFGGGVALELARSGADLRGVISFHGNLDTPNPTDANNIRGSVLVLHGAADPHVSPEQVAAFEKEMSVAGVDWEMVSYGGAVHAFTNPESGGNPATGAAYDAKADRRSWDAMRRFFDEILGTNK